MSAHQITGPLRASRSYYGGSGKYTPRVTDGDSARVLFFMNLSGAYDGYAGMEQADADARRIAACWNACEGIETGMLEGFSPRFLATYPDRVYAERKALEKQNAELLSVLESLAWLQVGDQLGTSDVQAIAAAIAKAKGGAA